MCVYPAIQIKQLTISHCTQSIKVKYYHGCYYLVMININIITVRPYITRKKPYPVHWNRSTVRITILMVNIQIIVRNKSITFWWLSLRIWKLDWTSVKLEGIYAPLSKDNSLYLTWTVNYYIRVTLDDGVLEVQWKPSEQHLVIQRDKTMKFIKKDRPLLVKSP